MKRKLWAAVMILMFLPLRVIAVQYGSVHLHLKYGMQPLTGGSITICKTDDWNWDGEMDAEMLDRYRKEHRLPGMTKELDSEGNVIFDNLEEGRYLIIQGDPVRGYYPIEPFLISIPVTINGEVIWEVEEQPKMQPLPDKFLPQTGQLRWPVPVLGGVGIILTCAGYLMIRKK